ncbi:MAG: hypothetical protein GF350_03850, partial [Chitinivibrionales bacterium]|nr:hypothetical protein [Chitinivibrionales bacterium]
MKPIVVEDQVHLGPIRCFKHSIEGMYYRLKRSSISVLILALAVAFLSYIVTYELIASDTEYHVFVKLQDSRMLSEWISRLSTADTEEEIIVRCVSGSSSRRAE